MKKLRNKFAALLFITLLVVCILSACGNVEKKQPEIIAEVPQISIQTGEPIEEVLPKDTSGVQEDKQVFRKFEMPAELLKSEYNLEPALSADSLKDTFAEYFTIGTTINGNSVEISTTRSPELSAIINYHFNNLTFSELMMPGCLLNQKKCKKNAKNGNDKPGISFDSIIEGMDFAKENGIKMRGHTLVWHKQVPDWFFREGYDDDNEYVGRNTMLARLDSYIEQVMEFTQKNYPGIIYGWDVVNEAIETENGYFDPDTEFGIRTHYTLNGTKMENLWYKIIGADYVEKSFQIARKHAAGDVKLFYNENNTYQLLKSLMIRKLLIDLNTKGLIDGIGMQGHIDLKNPDITGGTPNITDTIHKFAEIGLEIQLTDLTIDSGKRTKKVFQKQAERYRDLFKALLVLDKDNGGTANITNVTFSGLMDGDKFNENNKEYHFLFDQNLQPKPAFYSILGTADKN